VEACRVMAQVAEACRAPQALDWRRRIADLSQGVDDKLKLAATALQIQGPPWPLAAQTLEEIDQAGKESIAFHLISAELALRLNRQPEAEAHFQKASLLEPTNEIHRLNLAALRLRSTNPAIAAQARADLDGLRTSPNLSAIALRWLVSDSIARGDWPTAEQLSQRLLTDPRATMEDRLEHLRILQERHAPEFASSLESVQMEAATNVSHVYLVGSWMISHDLASQALEWLNRCPASVKSEQPVPLVMAETYVALANWTGLENYLNQEKWGEMEFLRTALLSQAAQEQHRPEPAQSLWRLAVHQAGDRLGALVSLLRMANGARSTEAKEELLWRVIRKYPRERWILQELNQLYVSAGNTAGLNKLSAFMMERDPRDHVSRNNYAATALLLKFNLSRAHELAREVYSHQPDDPVCASTYAYSLHVQGRTLAGLQVLEKLKPEALETPAIALYYGVLLAAEGQTNQARKYLSLAKTETLLPQERALRDSPAW
ncbi:MAG TPA: hypothetical protein VEC99_17465, partial [Clostridia bacterium]|nr:hypothetical protein [Clostridia bacterium]